MASTSQPIPIPSASTSSHARFIGGGSFNNYQLGQQLQYGSHHRLHQARSQQPQPFDADSRTPSPPPSSSYKDYRAYYNAFLSAAASGSFGNPVPGILGASAGTHCAGGNPMSFGSLGKGSFSASKFLHPAGSPGTLLRIPLDVPMNGTPFMGTKPELSSSIESEHGRLVRALNGADVWSMEQDMCRNYTCCGQVLLDLHALVEHFEEHHVVVLDEYQQQQMNLNAFLAQAGAIAGPSNASALPKDGSFINTSSSSSALMPPADFDEQLEVAAAGMEMEMDVDSDSSSSPSATGSSASTPPQTPLPLTPVAGIVSTASQLPFNNSNMPSSSIMHASHQLSAFQTDSVVVRNGPGVHRTQASLGPTYSPYTRPLVNKFAASYTPFSGAVRSANAMSSTAHNNHNAHSLLAELELIVQDHEQQPQVSCIPPALLFTSPVASRGTSPDADDEEGVSRVADDDDDEGESELDDDELFAEESSSRHGGRVTTAKKTNSKPMMKPTSANGDKSSVQLGPGGVRELASLTAAQLAALVSSQNTNPDGSKPFKPFRCPTPGCNKSYKQSNGLKYHVTHGQCNFAAPDPAVEGLSEREAEVKMKPYLCQVGCGKRFKNMSGLRYHYQHSGDHGQTGLSMLAANQLPVIG